MENKKGYEEICVVTIHRKAMKISPKIATGSTIGYETDKMPSWDEALDM
jgi:hypothetical protein